MNVFVVKAWNIETNSEFTPNRPKGRILHMTIGNDIHFIGAAVIVHIKVGYYLSPISLTFF